MTILNMIKDVKGVNAFGLPFSEEMYNTTLASGVAQSLTVPTEGSGNWLAIFGYETGATVWVSHNNTAANPGVTFAKIVSEANPVARFVKAGDTLSFITPDTNAEIGVVFYAIQ